MLKKLLPTRFNRALIPLCLVILVDHIGFGIFYPILVPIFMENGNILGLEAGESLKSFWYSVTLSIFPIALFFAASFLGSLSDRFGRKKVLAFCLVGAAGGYALAGIAVDCQSLLLLIFSRLVGGISAGSMPIAQAAAIDLSDESEKAGNIGIVILAGSLGFLLGPMIGGFFANSDIMPWFSYSTPLYCAALLALLNLWTLRFFNDTFVPKQATSFSLKQCFELITVPFKTKNIRYLAAIFLMMQLGWSFYFQFISVYLLKKYQFGAKEISLFMSLMGIGFAIGSCWVLRVITRYLQDNTATLASLCLVTLSIFATVFHNNVGIAWCAGFLLGISMATAYAIIVKLFSSTVSEDQQGWIMGVAEAIASVAWAITPLASAYLEQFDLTIPLTLATILLAGSAFMLRLWKPEQIVGAPKII